MATKAIRTQKTIIEWLKTEPSTYEKISGVKGYDGPGGKASIIDTTDLDSVAKEKLPGLPDEGAFTLTCNYIGSDAGQQAMAAARLAQDLVKLRVTFTDTSTASFDCYVMEWKISGRPDSVVELAMTFEIDGPVTYTEPTPLAASGRKAA